MQSLQGKITYVKDGNSLKIKTLNKEIFFATEKDSENNFQKD